MVPPSDTSLTKAFLDYSRTLLADEYWPRLRGCVESLTDEQVWWRPNDASNSVGNLVLHLNGNVRQWILVPFAGAEDLRDRPAEFKQRAQLPRSALIGELGTTVGRAAEVIRTLMPADLARTLNIQGYATTGL